jgi:riboflavin-specific deaminase-like protein
VIVPRRRGPLPYVVVNMAMTADGKTATANRRVGSFGSRRDLVRLYQLRATADAVLCGAATATQPGTVLGPGAARFRRERLRRGLAEYNLRVVVSGAGRIDLDAAVFRRRFSPVLVLTTERAGSPRLAALARVADGVAVCGAAAVDWRAAFAWLRSAWGVRRLICEGGGELNGALFAAGLVDELRLTICPLVFGGRAAPTLADGTGARLLAEAAGLRLASVRRIGVELFCRFQTRHLPGSVASGWSRGAGAGTVRRE